MIERLFELFEAACTLASLSLKEILCLLCLLAGFLLLIFNFWIGILIIAAGAIAWMYYTISGIFDDSEKAPDGSFDENHDGSAAADGPARAKTRRCQSPDHTPAYKEVVDESGYSKLIVFLSIAAALLILIGGGIIAGMAN